MSLVQAVENGKVVESSSDDSTSKSSATNSSSLDKEAFLQLLVAEMQNQDPLEPTSNTEYISQFAQFSSLEEMQNMSSSVDEDRANALVGKTVIMKTTSSTTGETSYVQGKVDYVVYESGESYLSINENLYSLDDLDTVVDADYLEAYTLATSLTTAISELPTAAAMTLNADQTNVESMLAIYDGMDDYQKTFVAKATVTSIEEYRTKLKELLAAKEAASSTTDDEEE